LQATKREASSLNGKSSNAGYKTKCTILKILFMSGHACLSTARERRGFHEDNQTRPKGFSPSARPMSDEHVSLISLAPDARSAVSEELFFETKKLLKSELILV
jgi:hypothetical protein